MEVAQTHPEPVSHVTRGGEWHGAKGKKTQNRQTGNKLRRLPRMAAVFRGHLCVSSFRLPPFDIPSVCCVTRRPPPPPDAPSHFASHPRVLHPPTAMPSSSNRPTAATQYRRGEIWQRRNLVWQNVAQQNGTTFCRAIYPPPPCASTALSKQGVGVELLFLGIFGTTVFVVPDVTWGLKTFYRTLPPNDVCFDMILRHFWYPPSTAYHRLHLRALLDVGGHVCLPSCVPRTSPVLSNTRDGR